MSDQNDGQYGTVRPPVRASNKSPSLAPVPKVQGASIGTIVGGAVAILIIGILKRNEVELSEIEAGAVQTIITTIFTFVGGYLTPPQGFGSDAGGGDAGGDQGFPPTARRGRSGGPDLGDPPTGPTGRLRWAGLAILMMALVPLAACESVVNPVGSLFGFQAIPAETPAQRIAVIEHNHQAALRTIDEMERSGLLQDQRVRSALAQAIRQASGAMDAANLAVQTGAMNQQATITAAQVAVNQLILFLREQQGAT